MRQQTSNILALSLAALLLGGCSKDMLDQRPQSSISPQDFFNNEQDLQTYTNGFYSMLPGTEIYSDDQTSDNVEPATTSTVVAGRTIVPSDAASAGWTWGDLRNVNYFLASYNKPVIPQEARDHYAGIARFFRAMFYFNKVKRFGDVPWYSKPLTDTSSELYKGQDPRTLVMDSIIADLDFATAHIRTGKNVSRVTRWAAFALKSRVCLFEGTFRKYHDELKLQGTANKLLQMAADAADSVMVSGQYKLYTTGKPNVDYLNLFAADAANTDEYILARVYDRSLNKTHAANGVFTTATLGAPGITKAMMDSYLMSDGTPFSQQPGFPAIQFVNEVKGRDPRFSQTVRTPGYTRTNATAKLLPDYTNALTGYQCIKFVTGTDQDGYNTNGNDLPVLRYAEVLLNYAEAKAELGTCTQTDIVQSINLLRTRVAMPGMDIATLPTDTLLQNQYPDVTNKLILEIRRERRVELNMEGFRYADLMRWKEGNLLAKTFLGTYFPNKGYFDLDGDGTNDIAVLDDLPATQVKTIQYYKLLPDRSLSNGAAGNLVVHPNDTKTFDETKAYVFPLPVTELLLNKNLHQNLNWK